MWPVWVASLLNFTRSSIEAFFSTSSPSSFSSSTSSFLASPSFFGWPSFPFFSTATASGPSPTPVPLPRPLPSLMASLAPSSPCSSSVAFDPADCPASLRHACGIVSDAVEWCQARLEDSAGFLFDSSAWSTSSLSYVVLLAILLFLLYFVTVAFVGKKGQKRSIQTKTRTIGRRKTRVDDAPISSSSVEESMSPSSAPSNAESIFAPKLKLDLESESECSTVVIRSSMSISNLSSSNSEVSIDMELSEMDPIAQPSGTTDSIQEVFESEEIEETETMNEEPKTSIPFSDDELATPLTSVELDAIPEVEDAQAEHDPQSEVMITPRGSKVKKRKQKDVDGKTKKKKKSKKESKSNTVDGEADPDWRKSKKKSKRRTRDLSAKDDEPEGKAKKRGSRREKTAGAATGLRQAVVQSLLRFPYLISGRKHAYDESKVVLLQTLWRGRQARKQLVTHLRRLKIVQEILETERSYVHALQTMITCYLFPLRSRATMQLSSSLSSVPTFETVSSSYFQSAIRNLNASFNIPTVVKLKKKRKDNKEKDGKSKKNPVISMQDLKTIFSQSEVIYNFNNHFLQTIHRRLEEWHYEQTIADIFLSVMDFYKVYTECVNGYSAAIMTLTACESSKKFCRFMEECNQNATEMGGLGSLPSYLIQPVQRLPRYVLLLQDLLKHTHESHPDFANLTKATRRMREIAQMVDERHSQAESLNHMFQLQYETKGLSRGYDFATVGSDDITTIATGPLLAPHRRLNKWGKLRFMLEAKSPRSEEVCCYLFTDLLLLISEQQSRVSPRVERVCRYRIPLLTLSLPAALSSSKDQEGSKFMLSTSRETFIFEAKHKEESKEWMIALRDSIRNLLEKQATFEAAKGKRE